jgi:acyl-CoA reductase-like NAD-dependent aldehyde dehydrogenase
MMFVAGRWEEGSKQVEVRSPWSGAVVSKVAQADAAAVERALAFASESRPRLAAQSSHVRRKVLTGIARGLEDQAAALAKVISDESGKPISAARVEVARAVETFTLAAAEVTAPQGVAMAFDSLASAVGTEGEVRRFPAGVVVGIVPFNFPLNLGAHKVAPALAVGCPIIVKPPPQAPGAQLQLARIAAEAGADPAALQVLPCDNVVAERLATDPRVRVLSFTGSAKVGWHLKGKAAGRVVLELGGNAAAIVCADADLSAAAGRLALSGFGAAGQVCIKVQRIIVEAPVYDAFVERFLREVAKLGVGDPSLDATVIGPVIDDAAASRIEAWVEEAVQAGAKRLLPARREGRVLWPMVLADVPRLAKVRCEEVFGPVVVVSRAVDFGAALLEANDSQWGLQAGVFTNDWRKARAAFHALEVGGVVVNDAPSFRADAQPYGGVKGSGLGREGLRSAMADYTEERTLVWRP